MLPPHLLPAPPTAADPYPVLGHFGSGDFGNVGDVGEACPELGRRVHSLLCQGALTLRAGFQGDRHVHWRFRDLLRLGVLTEGEGAGTWFTAGALGFAYPGAFGERRGLAFGAPPELGVLGPQRLNGGGQRDHLTLQLVDQTLLFSDQPQQVFPAQGGEILGGFHDGKYRLPGLRLQARAGNQLRQDYESPARCVCRVGRSCQ